MARLARASVEGLAEDYGSPTLAGRSGVEEALGGRGAGLGGEMAGKVLLLPDKGGAGVTIALATSSKSPEIGSIVFLSSGMDQTFVGEAFAGDERRGLSFVLSLPPILYDLGVELVDGHNT